MPSSKSPATPPREHRRSFGSTEHARTLVSDEVALHYLLRVLLPRERRRVPHVRHALPRAAAAAVDALGRRSFSSTFRRGSLDSRPAEVNALGGGGGGGAQTQPEQQAEVSYRTAQQSGGNENGSGAARFKTRQLLGTTSRRGEQIVRTGSSSPAAAGTAISERGGGSRRGASSSGRESRGDLRRSLTKQADSQKLFRGELIPHPPRLAGEGWCCASDGCYGAANRPTYVAATRTSRRQKREEEDRPKTKAGAVAAHTDTGVRVIKAPRQQ